MRLFDFDGPLKEFTRRESGRGREDDLWAWKKLMGKSKNHAKHLGEKQPDIVTKLNENDRIEKEKERIRKEKREAGEWDWHGESGEWIWTGKDPPIDEDSCIYEPLTEDEKRAVLEAEKRLEEAIMEQRKKEKLEAKREQERERKEKMAKPIDPLPERELCQYEIIRENIIKEREKSTANHKFFVNLNDTKKDVGLYKSDKPTIKINKGKC